MYQLTVGDSDNYTLHTELLLLLQMWKAAAPIFTML